MLKELLVPIANELGEDIFLENLIVNTSGKVETRIFHISEESFDIFKEGVVMKTSIPFISLTAEIRVKSLNFRDIVYVLSKIIDIFARIMIVTRDITKSLLQIRYFISSKPFQLFNFEFYFLR